MRVAAINDLSGFGKCSLVADISVISSLGIEVCSVPTAIFTAQTGFPSFYRHDTKDMVLNCKQEWKKMGMSFDGILTGYIPEEEVADYVLEFAASFKTEENVLLVDPVMGDGGRCYSNFSKELLDKIKKLSEKADILTPNLTELCLLAGLGKDEIKDIIEKRDSFNKITEIAELVRRDNKQTIVVTGIPGKGKELYNLIVWQSGVEVVKCISNGASYSGTGDLFAASLLGNVLNGKGIVSATHSTVDFISRAISVTTSRDRNYGINFETILNNGF